MAPSSSRLLLILLVLGAGGLLVLGASALLSGNAGPAPPTATPRRPPATPTARRTAPSPVSTIALPGETPTSPAPSPPAFTTDQVQLAISPTLPISGVEPAAFLQVQVALSATTSDTGPTFLPQVALEWRDGAGQPAIFGASSQPPLPLDPLGLPPLWSAVTSAPTQPGIYHARLQIVRQDVPTQTLDLPGPTLAVITTTQPLHSGFVYTRGGNLWLSSANAARTHKLTFYSATEDALDPAWAPDGQQIAYTHGLPVPLDQLPTSEIWSIRPDGSAAQPLVPRQPGEDLRYPAWLPDSHRLLFAQDRLVDPATGQPPPTDNPYAGVDSWAIEQLDIRTGARQRIVADATMPNVSRDGTRLVYVTMPAPSSAGGPWVPATLMLAGSDGRAPQVLVPGDQFLDLAAPCFSPDGQWVAFAAPIYGQGRHRAGQGLALITGAHPGAPPWDVFLVPAAGGTPRRLTRFSSDLPGIAWAPDSRHLAVLTNFGFYMISRDGQSPQLLGPGVGHSVLSWYAP